MPINNLNAGTPQVKPTTVATTNTNTENKADKPKISKDTAVKVAVGAGLAALAAGGIYIATRGKGGGKQLGESANALKEMTVDAFKKDGKFVKGKALTASGENYSGKLTKELKDGSTLTREYKDGLLQSATKTKDGNVLSSKSYSYNENGQLTKISNEKGTLVDRTIEKDRIETSITTKTSPSRIIILLDENGNKTYTSVTKTDKKSGKLRQDIIGFYPDGKHKRFVSKGGEGSSAFGPSRDVTFYDKDGKVTDTLSYKIGSSGNLSYKYKNIESEDLSPYKIIAGRRYSIDGGLGFDHIELQRHTIYSGKTHGRHSVYHLEKDGMDYGYAVSPKKSGFMADYSDEEKQKVLDATKDFKKLVLENIKTGRRLANECSEGEKMIESRCLK